MQIERKSICEGFINFIQKNLIPLLDPCHSKTNFVIEQFKCIKECLTDNELNYQKLNKLLQGAKKQINVQQLLKIDQKQKNSISHKKFKSMREGLDKNEIKHPYSFLMKPPGINIDKIQNQSEYNSRVSLHSNQQNLQSEYFNNIINIFQKIGHNFQTSHFRTIYAQNYISNINDIL